MILRHHQALWREVLAPGLLPTGRWLTIGVQTIQAVAREQPGFDFPTLTELLTDRGNQVVTLDLFDPRADLRLDLNEPIPRQHREQFDVLFDIGSIEHVFDTRQVFVNYLDLVRVGGHIFVHAPISGFYNHGLHTFSPEAMRDAFLLNGCQITYERYTLDSGYPLPPQHIRNVDALIWIVVQKAKSVPKFTNPQQKRWRAYTQPRAQALEGAAG